MEKKDYLSIAQAAKVLGISRIAVYKKVKKGEIKAIRIGKMVAIPQGEIKAKTSSIKGSPLKEAEKENIRKAVEKTVKDYGEVLKKLGAE